MINIAGLDRRFARPVPLPNGKLATTLREAADFILDRILKSQRPAPEWQQAGALLLLAASSETDAETERFRIAMMRALLEETLVD